METFIRKSQALRFTQSDFRDRMTLQFGYRLFKPQAFDGIEFGGALCRNVAANEAHGYAYYYAANYPKPGYKEACV